ncbi:hypothetical protein OGAPHI_002458 [Ogataea philodendri]|uniref:PQ loop repeat protein n=1 Tax=Ogataea philodendri TaxID=1378263 RepID=A0A9P8T7Q5_9ASCO|nr:uncharacterized protein OGAPHI_002458 [Ogataea philodendri]KAH3668704.1 hypothetical protein OGAPHI_002458 [Ogataea philodendri]
MESCLVYESPSVWGFLVGVLLALGIYVSYVPQHVKIINRRTSEGLSPLFLFLGSTSGFSAFVNLLLTTAPARQCCVSELDRFQCLNSQVGLIQVGVQTVGYTLILVLCAHLTRPRIETPDSDGAKIARSYKWFLVYAGVNLAIAVYFLVFVTDYSKTLKFANLSGLVSTVLATGQYLPQIHTTYVLKHPGSLSVHMMMLQTPGGYLWCYSLFMQPGSRWSSWLPYFTAASLQLILLLMCLYFRETHPEQQNDGSPLLV